MKILIIKHGALGDIILALRAISAISNHFKKAKITILTEKKYLEIFSNLPFVSDLRIDNRPKFFFFYKFFVLIYWFNKNKFDWIFDLQTSNRTAIYFKVFSFFGKFNWSGIEKNCSHPHLDENRVKLHTVERQKKQLEIVGISKIENIDLKFLNADLKKFKLPEKVAIIVPGGSKKRREKRWNLNHFQEIINYLSDIKIIPVIVGGKDEKEIVNKLNIQKCNCINLVGKTNFSELASLARKALLIVGNDTGPMHLLAECSSKSVKKIVLFGSDSDPDLCAPVAKNVIVLQKKCINNITTKEVKELILKNI